MSAANQQSETQTDPKLIRLTDGRRLSYRDSGDETAFPIVALHGTPGSRLKFTAAEPAAQRLGLRLIVPDRWGYGRSDAPALPRLQNYARDIAELATQLGVGSFAVLGVSGGGPYGAAVAASLGARIDALALVSPVGPIAGSCTARELGLFHAFCFRLLPAWPGAVAPLFRAYRRMLASAPGRAMQVTAFRAPTIDAALLRKPGHAQQLTHALLAGLEAGVRGPVIDMQLFSRPWDFALRDISAPSRIWLGEADGNVPRIAARRLAGAIPGGELTLLPRQGHYWILENYETVLRWLARAAAAAAQPMKSGRKLPERPPAR